MAGVQLTLIGVIRFRSAVLAGILFLWVLSPALACLMPGVEMTMSQMECCQQMTDDCGKPAMPSIHSCCAPAKGNPSDFTLSKSTAPPTLIAVAVLPRQMSPEAPEAARSTASESPPEPSPGSSEILRI